MNTNWLWASSGALALGFYGCAEESCDDFLGCTIGAGAQCTFGV
jgi:hypothetical protein